MKKKSKTTFMRKVDVVRSRLRIKGCAAVYIFIYVRYTRRVFTMFYSATLYSAGRYSSILRHCTSSQSPYILEECRLTGGESVF